MDTLYVLTNVSLLVSLKIKQKMQKAEFNNVQIVKRVVNCLKKEFTTSHPAKDGWNGHLESLCWSARA